MQILYVVNDLAYFRAHREHLAMAMVGRGHQVAVACGGVIESALKDWPSELALTEIPMDKHRLNLWMDGRLLFSLLNLCKRLKPDVVHAVTIKPILFTGLALAFRRLTGTKCGLVWTFAGLGKVFEPPQTSAERLRKSIVAASLKLTARLTHAHGTFENEQDRDALLEEKVLPAARAHTVQGTGLDLNEFCVHPKGSAKITNFLMASRLIREKGVDTYLAAAREIKQAGLNAQFLLAGGKDNSNPDRVADDVIARAHKEGSIEFRGEITQAQMPGLLNEADVVCLPTRLREGFPRSLLEAAACGAAMIASRQKVIEKLVVPGETGWLIDADGPNELVKAMKAAIDKPQQTAQFGLNARARVESMPVSDFDIAEAFHRIYREAHPDE